MLQLLIEMNLQRPYAKRYQSMSKGTKYPVNHPATRLAPNPTTSKARPAARQPQQTPRLKSAVLWKPDRTEQRASQNTSRAAIPTWWPVAYILASETHSSNRLSVMYILFLEPNA